VDDWRLTVYGIALLVPLSLLLFYPFWHETWERDLARLKQLVRRFKKPRP
jgi:hypothetical protein